MRGGLVIGGGILAGNVLGFVRGAVTAYLLGTHAAADALSVALGPVDTLNAVLINTMIFAFVPLLAARHGADRALLFRRASRLFSRVFWPLTAAMVAFAPALVRVLGPGLAQPVHSQAVDLLRLASLSTVAVGAAALHSALLYTERRFGPSAFYQATLNVFVIFGALALWRTLGIYGFAIGYTAGAVAQYLTVWWFARKSWRKLAEAETAPSPTADDHTTAELLSKPCSFLLYAGLLAINMIVTRAYATQAGSGMAAAFDYSIRCVNVVIAYLVAPLSNSLLPEIAKRRSENRSADAFRLINRSLALAAVAALASCVMGMIVAKPVIAILFERGNFTPESTTLVTGVFLGIAPSLIGLSLLELMSRSLFALDRPWLPVFAAITPVVINILVSAAIRPHAPETIGIGASAGLLVGFALLFILVLSRRRHWSEALPLEHLQAN